MRKLLTILFILIPIFVFTQDLRKIDWKFIPSNIEVIGENTYDVTANPTDYNDPGVGQKEVGFYVVDYGLRAFRITAVNGSVITVYDLAEEGLAPMGGQIAHVYQSVADGDTLFQSIGGINILTLDDNSKWKQVARDNELFARAIKNVTSVEKASNVEAVAGLDTIKYITPNTNLTVDLLRNVPYYGAVDAVHLGDYTLQAGGIIFKDDTIRATTQMSLADDTLSTKAYSDERVVWKDTWQPVTYLRNDMVFDNGYTMIANKTTEDRAAPQAIGDVHYAYDGTIGEDSEFAKQIVYGQRYSLPRALIIKGYRVYTKPDLHYNIYIVRNPLSSPVIEQVASFTGSINGWVESAIEDVLVEENTIFDLLVLENEPAPTPIEVVASYDYDTPNNPATPASGQISHANKSLGILSINETDNNGTNRSALLANLTAGDIIEGAGASWSIQSSSDEGNYWNFGVTPASQGSPDGIQDFNFQTVTATPIDYGYDANYWSTYPSVQGLYIADGSYEDIVPNQNAYGLDILYQDVVISEDWDLVSSTGAGGGSSGGDIITNSYLLLDDVLEDTYTGKGTNLSVVNDIETGMIFQPMDAIPVSAWLDDGTYLKEVPPISYLELTDVLETDYTGKSGYLAAVNSEETGMILYPDSAIIDVDAGVGIIIDKTNPQEPIISAIPGSSAGVISNAYFTGDEETTSDGTFYKVTRLDKGTVGTVERTITSDGETNWWAQDYLGGVATEQVDAYAGDYSGVLSLMSTNTKEKEQFFVELYLADSEGVPYNSGITGAPIGSYGFEVVTIMTTGVTDLPSGEEISRTVTGAITEGYTRPAGTRIRIRIGGTKVGTGGARVTLTLFTGFDHEGYITVPIALNTNTVLNKSDVLGATATDALNSLLATNELQVDKVIPSTDKAIVLFDGVEGDQQDSRLIVDGMRLYHSNSSLASFFIGYDSGLNFDQFGGLGNFGLGSNSLSLIRFGTGNTATGKQALEEYDPVGTATNQGWNSAYGEGSLRSLKDGNRNSGLGESTLEFLEYGSNNIALGTVAGSKSNAGTVNLTQSENSIFIGRNAGPAVNNSINEIVIGDLGIGNGNNTITLGSSTTTKTFIESYLTHSPASIDSESALLSQVKQTAHDTIQQAYNTNLIWDLGNKTISIYDSLGLRFVQDTLIGLLTDADIPDQIQELSTNGSAGNVQLSNGGGTIDINVNDADFDPFNEIQDISGIASNEQAIIGIWGATQDSLIVHNEKLGILNDSIEAHNQRLLVLENEVDSLELVKANLVEAIAGLDSAKAITPLTLIGTLELYLEKTATNVIPSGVIDSINVVFSTNEVISYNTSEVYLNGVKQTIGTHYYEDTNSIQFYEEYVPRVGDIIRMNYKY